jgi:hypothetical protein
MESNHLDEWCLNVCCQIGVLNAKEEGLEKEIEEMSKLHNFLCKAYLEVKRK